MALVGVELVQEFVSAILLTGKVAHSHPVSTMLIADPECGKSSIVMERPCESAIVLSDVTATGLGMLTQQFPHSSHIVVSEMSVLMAHGKKARDLLFGMLMPLLEEGLSKTATPHGIVDFKGAKRGLIACVPPSIAKDGRSWWYRSGLATRIIPFQYQYRDELVIKIFAQIREDKPESQNTIKPLNIPKLPIRVEMSKEIAEAVEVIARQKSQSMGQHGIRLVKNYRALLKGRALIRHGWKNPAVTDEDLTWLARINSYVSWEGPALL